MKKIAVMAVILATSLFLLGFGVGGCNDAQPHTHRTITVPDPAYVVPEPNPRTVYNSPLTFIPLIFVGIVASGVSLILLCDSIDSDWRR